MQACLLFTEGTCLLLQAVGMDAAASQAWNGMVEQLLQLGSLEAQVQMLAGLVCEPACGQASAIPAGETA